MGRVTRFVLIVAVLWAVAAVLSTWESSLPDPDCYLSATWDGKGWEYGSWECAADQDPPEFDPEASWREMDVDVLADVALGEDPWALEAVMWTVLNRRADPSVPLEAVVRHRQAYGTVRGGRFRASWSPCPTRGRWAQHYPLEWAHARQVAQDVLSGLVPDPTAGATHFHRAGSWRPPWAPARACWRNVGRHHFYREAAC